MTTKERKETLRKETVKKYERLKYKVGSIYHNGEISADDERMRLKFLTREENLRLAEIDQMSAKEAKKCYDKLMKKINPGT